MDDAPVSGSRPSRADYQALAEFRYRLRCFLEFSEKAAQAVGLSPQQHQALLAIKGFPGPEPMTISELAERLRVRHHTAVELVNRLNQADFVRRARDATDHRRVRLLLTSRAEDILGDLSATHLEELAALEPALKALLTAR